MARIQKTDDTKYMGYGTAETLTYCWKKCKWYNHFAGQFSRYKPKQSYHTISNHANKVCTYTILHTNVYSSSIHIVKKWKQPKCPSIGEWMKKIVVHPYNRIFSQQQENEQQQKDMDGPYCIFLSERNQSEKATYCLISTTWCSRKDKTTEIVKRSAVVRD